MHVFHTVGVPPRHGNKMRATIGCTMKRIEALVNSVAAHNQSIDCSLRDRSVASTTCPGRCGFSMIALDSIFAPKKQVRCR